MVNQLPPVRIAVLSFHPLMNCPLFPREKQSLSFHALTNCPFSIPFVLTFMHRMGGVGGTLNIQTFKPANIPTLSQSSSHTGRIAKTIRPRRLKNAKNPNSCFHGKYFLLSKSIPRTASSPVTISARASTQSPSSFPLAVHGAIRTRGLLRIRFTFPETPIVYAKSFAPLASSRTDGSAANHTGVFTPSPLFLNVSRFKYLCPANAANPIASPPAIPRKAFYAGRKKVGQTFLSVQGFPFVFWAHNKHKERRGSAGAPFFPPLRKTFLLRSHVRHILRERVLLVFAERPGRFEMIVVNKSVRRMMHVPTVRALQVRNALQSELQRLRLRRIRSAHRRLVTGHAVVRQFDLIAIQIIKRDHFHRLAVFFHAEFFHHGRSAGRQFQVQRRLVHVRLVGFPVADESFQFLKRFRSATGPRLRHHRQDCHAQHQRTKNLHKTFHRSFSSHESFRLAMKKNKPLESQCSARSRGRFGSPAETLRRESHDRAEKHARNHNVPK